jgi:MoaA/NifB/PqqE/SkfB family radical SAM enzyme
VIPYRNFRRFFRKAVEQPEYALGVAFKRLRTYAAYRREDGRAPSPEALTIFLTHRCNLRCKMCGQWGDHGVTRATGGAEAELSLPELQRLIGQVADVHPAITLFGGEPFFHRDIIPLIQTITARELHCLVITNGSLLEAHAAELVSLGLDELNLSLDGERSTHDEIRGMPGLFERIVDGIDAVNREKDRQGARRPLINLQCTISRDNAHRLDEMLSVAVHLRANSLTFHHLIFLDQATYDAQEAALNAALPGTGSTGWKGFVFDSGIDPRQLADKIREIKRRRSPVFVNFFPNFSEEELTAYYTNPRYLPESYRPRCVSPWMTAYVFPTGDVRPCLNLDYSFGKIQDMPFNDIWNGEKAVAFRRALKERKIFPACIRCTELFRY